MTRTFILFIGFNLVFGFFTPGVDIAGHIGGLIAGFLMGYVVGAPQIGRVAFIKRIFFCNRYHSFIHWVILLWVIEVMNGCFGKTEAVISEDAI
ncbi:rhomboid family intramembrane serine protease [Secundilactobacillus kimchicus]|uniref:rhomboid family intramembrane serine protease n=1 Tax=Secundilactobacillus kimchicus TaxID=528209 RepID=UPI000A408A39